MVIGFVLMHISPVHEHEIFQKLSQIPEVIELHTLFGEYDLLAKIEAKNYTGIGEIIIHKIKTIEGITDTKTLTGKKLK